MYVIQKYLFLGLEQVDKEILKSLTSSNGNNSFEVKISGQNFSEYCVENFDGIFLKAMTHFWIPNDDENAKNWLKAVTTALLKLVVSGTNYFGLLLEVCGKRVSTFFTQPILMDGLLKWVSKMTYYNFSLMYVRKSYHP